MVHFLNSILYPFFILTYYYYYYSFSSDKDSCSIKLYDGRGGINALVTINSLHTSPVHLMKFNPVANVVISSDEKGSIEYWTPDVSVSPVVGDEKDDDGALKIL